MKKIFALMLMLAMIVTPVFAEGLDLAGMSFEELTELKQAVDNEYFARPESEPKVLQPGLYTVGKDIAAGTYHVIVADFGASTNAFLYLYADQAAYDDGHESTLDILSLPDRDVLGPSLEDGNVLDIEYLACAFSVSGFEEDDFPQYEAPEGTLIPKGTYTIGELIPAGAYQVYAATIKNARLYIFKSQESYDALEPDEIFYVEASSSPEGTMHSFDEGDILLIDNDVIMKKQAAFTFD